MFGPRNQAEAEVYVIEELLAETQYCIQRVMGKKAITRSELARRLGCSAANVTQMLSEESNLTLDSIARIFHALEDRFIVKSKFLESGKGRFGAIEDFSSSSLILESEEYATAVSGKFLVGGAARAYMRRTRREPGILAQPAEGVEVAPGHLIDYDQAA